MRFLPLTFTRIASITPIHKGTGMGWIEVGKASQALKRTLVDQSVSQANRLDFSGPPELGSCVVGSVIYD